jgi:hypothetical protein
MGALDKRLYTSPHAPTDTVARVGPDRVKLVHNGCMLPTASHLSEFPRTRPHPCVVAAHRILHARPPDASGCESALRIQTLLMTFHYCV